MFRFVAVVFAAILAVVFATPSPNPKPGVFGYAAAPVAYSAPLAYSAHYSYSAPAYAAPAVVSTYGAAHLPYSAATFF